VGLTKTVTPTFTDGDCDGVADITITAAPAGLCVVAILYDGCSSDSAFYDPANGY